MHDRAQINLSIFVKHLNFKSKIPSDFAQIFIKFNWKYLFATAGWVASMMRFHMRVEIYFRKTKSINICLNKYWSHANQYLFAFLSYLVENWMRCIPLPKPFNESVAWRRKCLFNFFGMSNCFDISIEPYFNPLNMVLMAQFSRDTPVTFFCVSHIKLAPQWWDIYLWKFIQIYAICYYFFVHSREL